MLRLTPDGGGGFFLFDDPVADLTGEMGLVALFMAVLSALILPITINPTEFAAPLLCILLGLFLILLSFGMGVFHFLSAFALPFVVYGIAGYSAAVFHNAPSSPISILLFLFVPFVICLILIGVMNVFGMEEGLGVLFAVLGAGIIFFCTVSFSPGEAYTPPKALFYLIRVTWVAAFIKAGGTVIYDLVQAGKGKKKLDVVSPMIHLPLALLGFLPLLLMKLLPGLAGFGLGSVAYVGICVLYLYLQNTAKGQRDYQPSILILPLLWVLMGYLSSESVLLFHSELIPEVISGIRSSSGAFCTDLYWQVTETAGEFFVVIFRAIANLVLLIFDTSIPHFHMPNLLSYVLLLILEWSLILILPKRILKIKN